MTRDVDGFVAPGFERVRDVLAESELDDGGGAFTAIVGGEVVVDLWTGWQQDTVACAYSASKGVVMGCLVLLHHEGRLALDAPVSSYWPEFAAAGKERITVRQLLSHSAGLVGVPDYLGFLGVHGEGWDQHGEIRARLAAATPLWEPGTAHGYHGLTIGYLAGALVERLTGMSLPALFESRRDVLGDLDLRFGVGPETDGRRATQLEPAPLTPEQEAVAEAVKAIARDPETLLGKAFLAQEGTTVLEHLVAAGSTPACMNVGAGNGDVIASARGLACFYDTLARGELAASTAAFSEVHLRGPDLVLGVPATWCVGFQGNAPHLAGGLAMGPGERAFGHAGAGGQLAGWDPDRELAFGFLRNQLSSVGTVSRDLVDATAAAIG